MMKVLITGAAGFIGSSLYNKLKTAQCQVFGLDNFVGSVSNNPQLQHDRKNHFKLDIDDIDLTDQRIVNDYISYMRPDIVIHLAARAGVRNSFDEKDLYIKNNIIGTSNLITACENNSVYKVIYASSSNVYSGDPCEKAWTEDMDLPQQLNPYGYSKYVNEIQFQHSRLQTVGLRFFTVYGPWGRTDMAPFLFTDKIYREEKLTVFNYGDMYRDFTYIDDIVDGIIIAMHHGKNKEIYNIGNSTPIYLMDFVKEISSVIGKTPTIDYRPKHFADPLKTWADVSKLKELGYAPIYNYKLGVKKMIEWYIDYCT